MHSAGPSLPIFADVEPAAEVHWWTEPMRPGSADITSSAILPTFDAYADWPRGMFDQADFRRSATPPDIIDMGALRNTIPPPVMFPVPSSSPPPYLDTLAFSSYTGTSSGRMMQQHLGDAVATSASGGMSTRASGYSSLTDWAGATTTAVPAGPELTRPAPTQPAPPQAVITAVSEGSAPVARKPPPTPRKRQSTEKKFPCPYHECAFVSAREYNLKDHIRTVHLGERPFPCPDCPEAFKKKHDMQRHYQSFHTDLGSPRNNVPRRR
ncbi:uncharacterized protein TRAVEDRAFT_42654 [Trametes versicolor FP-101664 SS1]|uniref:uncharacterized protein n=1 Tax=Trametes versicolor (strain FP-101664) TaxID=717944 RepID=UPI00046212E4|nr:uncharacterized protein TRAVEDRAFT_42654 [Trametes versicolor FP-101664 SS1]EIW65275.1 hypothetical protein TRAVEDRAFT_42654 [Trametes versicolor FP-101664 SS1]